MFCSKPIKLAPIYDIEEEPNEIGGEEVVGNGEDDEA